jgi:hypothetical protein
MIQQPTVPETASPLAAFLRALLDEGLAVVSSSAAIPSADADTERLLRTAHGALSRTLAGHAPEFSLGAAIWAAQRLYQLSRFVVCRDIPAGEVATALAERCPEPRGASVDWSVDIAFRLLPEIYRTARHLSNADPLINEIKKFAEAWPLSSVGIPDLHVAELDSFISHPALLQLYVDRVLATGDASRLNDERVKAAVRTTLGVHRDLSSAIAAKVFAEAESCVLNAT